MRDGTGAGDAGDVSATSASSATPRWASSGRLRSSDLPAEPGVYLFRDGDGRLLYVGKAGSLRRRVASYFRTAGILPFRTRTMVENARTLELLVVRTEREALLLESTLIKRLRPRHNRRLKDARSYPYLVIDTRRRSPCVLLAWETPDDGAESFGPFPDVAALRRTLQQVRRLYTVRRETLERHAPAAADQARMARDLLGALNGSSRAMSRRIESAMREAADALEFRRAARLRQALQAVEAMACSPRPLVHGATVDTVEILQRTLMDLTNALPPWNDPQAAAVAPDPVSGYDALVAQ